MGNSNNGCSDENIETGYIKCENNCVNGNSQDIRQCEIRCKKDNDSLRQACAENPSNKDSNDKMGSGDAEETAEEDTGDVEEETAEEGNAEEDTGDAEAADEEDADATK